MNSFRDRITFTPAFLFAACDNFKTKEMAAGQCVSSQVPFVNYVTNPEADEDQLCSYVDSSF